MRRLGRRIHFSARIALLSALLLAFYLPARAQSMEPDFVGVYRSEAMDNEITGDTIVWQLSLLPDQTAEAMIVFVTRDSVNFEVGTWATGEDGTLGVTFERRFDHQGGREHAIEPPFTIVFSVESDTLTAGDYLFYGPGDLILTRTDDAPVSVLDANGDLLDELKSGLSAYPDSLYLGTYRTQDFVIEDNEQWFALEILPGGRATLDYAPFADQESTHSRARWRNNGDGTLTLEIEADLDASERVVEAHDPPLAFSDLERLDSGGLVIRDILLPDGKQLIFSRTASAHTRATGAGAAPIAAGLYGGGRVADDLTRIGMLLDLRADGSLEIVVTPLDGASLPMATLGAWKQTELTVTLTLSGEIGALDDQRVVRAAAQPPEVLMLDEGRLVGTDITFNPLPVDGASASNTAAAEVTSAAPPRATPNAAAPATKNDQVATEDVTYMVGREQLVAGVTVVLALNADGSASMSTQLGADADILLELGQWEEDADTVILTLDRSAFDGEPYAAANVLTFTRTNARTLMGIDYDTERYGVALVLFDTRDF